MALELDLHFETFGHLQYGVLLLGSLLLLILFLPLAYSLQERKQGGQNGCMEYLRRQEGQYFEYAVLRMPDGINLLQGLRCLTLMKAR